MWIFDFSHHGPIGVVLHFYLCPIILYWHCTSFVFEIIVSIMNHCYYWKNWLLNILTMHIHSLGKNTTRWYYRYVVYNYWNLVLICNNVSNSWPVKVFLRPKSPLIVLTFTTKSVQGFYYPKSPHWILCRIFAPVGSGNDISFPWILNVSTHRNNSSLSSSHYLIYLLKYFMIIFHQPQLSEIL